MLSLPAGQSINLGAFVPNNATADANTAVVITIAAIAGIRHILRHVQLSYSSNPSGGNILVEDGSGNTILDLAVINGGTGGFTTTLPGTVNTAMIITLAAGGGATIGTLNTQSIEYAV